MFLWCVGSFFKFLVGRLCVLVMVCFDGEYLVNFVCFYVSGGLVCK